RPIPYGFRPGADVRGVDPEADGQSRRCEVRYELHGVPAGSGEARLELQVPGRHNLQNALAAIAVGLEIGVPIDRILAALASFHGVGRRYQRRGVVRVVNAADGFGPPPPGTEALRTAARPG